MLLSGLVLISVSWSPKRSEASSRKPLDAEDTLRLEAVSIDCRMRSELNSGESWLRKLIALVFFVGGLLGLFRTFISSSRRRGDGLLMVEALPLELPDSCVAVFSLVRFDMVEDDVALERERT